MSRRSTVLALVAAFLVPILTLGWIGLRSLSEEARLGTERHREQAETIALAVEARLASLVSELRAPQTERDEFPCRFAFDGTWLGETLESERAPAASEPAPLGMLENEIDRLQARGDVEAAAQRLEEIAAKSDDPKLVAWALDTRAAFQDQLGRAEEARATRNDLIARFPAARNVRGTLRSLGAQLALADGAADPVQARLELYEDAARDYTGLEQTASAEFVRQLRADLGARIGAADPRARELERIDREDARRARLRVWLASSRRGPSDWVARGAPGGVAAFAAAPAAIHAANPLSMEAPLDPLRAGDGVFLVALERKGDAWEGGAIELDRLFEDALRPTLQDANAESLGFTVSFQSKRDSAPDPLARLSLAGAFEDYAIDVRGGDMAAFVAGERRRFALVAGLVALAILTAAAGAWLSLRAIAREVEAARGRESFVAAVTHELKTPLAAIRLFAEMLEKGDVEPAKVREFGARTVHESDRLARLVDSVLDLARIEHAGKTAPRARVQLSRVALSAIAIVEEVARESGFEVGLRPAPAEVEVDADADALIRALVNLLDNALKYGERPHRVEVEIVRRADGFAEIAVLDRGRGVPENERQLIFEPFRRVGSELTRDRPGVGLGLALVARIAAAHGGRAVCEARDGGGSRFALILPLAASETA